MSERPDPLAPPPGMEWLEVVVDPSIPPGMAVLRNKPADPVQAALDEHVGAGPLWKYGDHNDEPGCDVLAGTYEPCGIPGGWWVWIGCGNEHIDRSQACDRHISAVEATTWTCDACKKKTGRRVEARMIKKEPWTDDHDHESGNATVPGVHRQPPALP